MTPELVEEFLDKVRGFYKKRGYTEVITPYLLPYPNLDDNVFPIPCEVKDLSNTKRVRYLHTSPEYSMKKLLSRYGRDIFQICHVFRNKEGGKLHDWEFLMLEYYKVGEDYNYLMEEIGTLLRELFGEKITYKEKTIVNKPIKVSLKEAYKIYLGLDLELLFEDIEKFKEQMEEKNIYFESDEDRDTLFFRTYVELESFLGFDAPTFIYGFPKPYGALARCQNGYCERFELYMFGIELANGYTEINNPQEVERRLKESAERLNLPLDKRFAEIHKNLPDLYSGVSVGLDRLMVIKFGLDSIHNLYYRSWLL
jgi:lysyl-tRNA synthetase class 2